RRRSGWGSVCQGRQRDERTRWAKRSSVRRNGALGVGVGGTRGARGGPAPAGLAPPRGLQQGGDDGPAAGRGPPGAGRQGWPDCPPREVCLGGGSTRDPSPPGARRRRGEGRESRRLG